MVWRIEEYQIELPPLFAEPSESPAQIKLLDLYLLRMAKGCQVPRHNSERSGVLVNKDHEGGASTQGFQPQGAGTGEEVQHPGSTQSVAKNTENGLSHPIGCGP